MGEDASGADDAEMADGRKRSGVVSSGFLWMAMRVRAVLGWLGWRRRRTNIRSASGERREKPLVSGSSLTLAGVDTG